MADIATVFHFTPEFRAYLAIAKPKFFAELLHRKINSCEVYVHPPRCRLTFPSISIGQFYADNPEAAAETDRQVDTDALCLVLDFNPADVPPTELPGITTRED